MTPDMVRQLPDGHGLVIRGSHAPVIARLAVAWKDPAYKAARRAGTAIAQLPAGPEPVAQPGPATPAAAKAAPAAAGRARRGHRSRGRARRGRSSGLPVELRP